MEKNNEFALDVDKGLSSYPKYLPSKYFYNEKGSRLFQMIMQMPEYYLTDCEFEILRSSSREMLEIASNGMEHINLVEFGAGDGFKTIELLKAFNSNGQKFKYIPIDISIEAIDSLKDNINGKLNGITIEPMNMEYFKALANLKTDINGRNFVLFLGSNIGNFSLDSAVKFLSNINDNLNDADYLLIGFDLIKDPYIIKEAYDDKYGITRAFNLNLLERINRELGGNFDIDRFDHYPLYNPENGEAKSYIISKKKQEVFIEKLSKTFHFEYAEPVFVEVSQKYTITQIEKLAQDSGFRITDNFYDCKHYFTDSLWQK